MVKAITSQDEFDKVLKEECDKLVVVDFTATWCGPCNKIAPFYKELSDTYKDVVFLKVDVDEVAEVAESNGIKAMPTFIFFKKGQKLCKIEGADRTELKAKIEKLK